MRRFCAIALLAALLAGCARPIAPGPKVPVAPEPPTSAPVAPTPVAPTPVAPTPVAPTPVAPTPVAPATVSPAPLASDMPQLLRVTPDGKETLVAVLKGVPDMLFYYEGVVRFQETERHQSYTIDVMTGKETANGSWISGAHGFGEIQFWTSDFKRMAEVFPPLTRGSGKGRLVVSEGGKTLFELANWLPVWLDAEGPCRNHEPSGAWRPDGGLLAVTAWPERDRVELLMLDPSTRSATLFAKQEATGRRVRVTWSPNGRFITFGSALLEAATGKVISMLVDEEVRWSPDGERFLTSHPLTSAPYVFGGWAKLSLVDASSGGIQGLGYGWPLGWTPSGEALLARWDAASHFTAPTCP